ncbi:hypothetical protein PBY51_019340 [Eleginops maclovinus]|uniref:Chemokine interleukin-8-like domain-containing protein n=1 Tax=Eleginops maclovinus TaxID=56733 RepID=A0AAN8AY04_ELEMC|nr:hypothetical protein PBY51_019340 [Eleginops maclovinus]
MQTLVTLVLLTCFMLHCSAGPVAPSASRVGCCLGFNQTKIPRAAVKHMAMTLSDCPSKAIVITTVCGANFCIDPNWKFAKKQFALFQNSPSRNGFNSKKCRK